MTTSRSILTALSDEALLARVDALAADERHATAELIASLAELDARRLYLGAGCSSLFTYCTEVLHLSEHAAYGRIEAARAARRFPLILNRLQEGTLTLTAVRLLSSVLTEENHRELLEAARHKSKREVEQLVACVRPQPAVPSVVRKLPTVAPPVTQVKLDDQEAVGIAAKSTAPPPLPEPPRPAARRPVVAPLAPERYKVQFTLSAEGHEKLRRAQDLLRHVIPNGDPAAVFERALTLLVEDLERKKLALTSRPRPARRVTAGTRHIPAAVRREVWKRDGGQCGFVGTNGRCTQRGLLEFHHVVPYAERGEATVDNIQLRCAAHNAYEAERWFGRADLAREGPATYGSTRSGPSWASALLY